LLAMGPVALMQLAIQVFRVSSPKFTVEALLESLFGQTPAPLLRLTCAGI
jgi:hypothetical protein